MSIGLSGRSSVRDTIAREKARISQSQWQFDSNKLAQGVLGGQVSSSDIASLQELGVLPQQQEEADVSSLMSDRANATEQGLDTSYFDKQLQQLGITGGSQTQLSEKEKKAINALNNLKTLFGRGDAKNVGTKKDLGQRTGRGLLGNVLNIVNKAATGIGFKGKTAEDIKKFKAALESAAPVFTQALGSGTPQEGEFKRLVESAPGQGSTDGEVKSWFNQMEAILSGQPLASEQKTQDSGLDQIDEDLINKYKTQGK